MKNSKKSEAVHGDVVWAEVTIGSSITKNQPYMVIRESGDNYIISDNHGWEVGYLKKHFTRQLTVTEVIKEHFAKPITPMEELRAEIAQTHSQYLPPMFKEMLLQTIDEVYIPKERNFIASMQTSQGHETDVPKR